MSAGFAPYTLRSVLRAHSRTSRRNYSSRDYSSRILSSASTHPRTRHRSLLYHPTSVTDQQATEGRWQYTTLSSRAVGDRRWRGCCGARDGPPAKRNVQLHWHQMETGTRGGRVRETAAALVLP